MTESLDTTLLDIVSFTADLGLIASLVAFFRLPTASRSDYGLLGIMICLSLLTEVAGTVGGMIVHFNMNLSNSLYALLEPVLLLFFYRDKMHSQRFRSMAVSLAITLVIFGLVDLFYLQGPFKINSYMKVATSFTMLVVCVSIFTSCFVNYQRNRSRDYRCFGSIPLCLHTFQVPSWPI